MNITNYVRIFGKYTFKEKPFNEIDGLVFSQLSYVHLEDIIKIDKKIPSLAINKLDDEKIKKISKNTVDGIINIPFLKALKASNRFKNVLMNYPLFCLDKENENQFFAITFILPNSEIVIAYRGTDITLIGWKEDVNMALMDVIPSQNQALNYFKKIREIYRFNKFYLLGHSKGGNLAYFVALKMDEIHQEYLLGVYSYDGPGFRKADIFMENSFYDNHKELFHKFVPQSSLVGMLLNHTRHAAVIYSTGILILNHDPFYWQVNIQEGRFKYVKRRHTSYINERALENWINNLSQEDKIITANAIFDFLGGLDKTIYDLGKNIPKALYMFLKNYKEYDEEKKIIIKENVKKLLSYYRKTLKYFKENGYED